MRILYDSNIVPKRFFNCFVVNGKGWAKTKQKIKRGVGEKNTEEVQLVTIEERSGCLSVLRVILGTETVAYMLLAYFFLGAEKTGHGLVKGMKSTPPM